MKSASLFYAVICYLSIFILPLAAAGKPRALATFTPCSKCPTGERPPLITITKQYQPISTCYPHTTCHPHHQDANKSRCSVEYHYSTYKWVSTVIPCAGTSHGKRVKKCTITKTDQLVTVKHESSKTTVIHPKPTKGHPRVIRHVEVIVTDYITKFNMLGPIGIPGYGGSGLCKKKDCGPRADGAILQKLRVHRCTDKRCQKDLSITWTSFPATTMTITVPSPVYQTISVVSPEPSSDPDCETEEAIPLVRREQTDRKVQDPKSLRRGGVFRAPRNQVEKKPARLRDLGISPRDLW